jgi:glycosyltransferase involved in cell wall biosynthesis
MSMKKDAEIDISIVVTTHAESILIHRTIASIKRAINALDNTYKAEIILHADNPTPETVAYIQGHANTTLKDARIFQNSFKDLGASRNFSIQQATGKYISTIDADDLMSKNWLKDALDYLVVCSEPTIAHSEVTIEFEGADSLVLKHGEIDHETDTLLSVYANRWNSVIIAPRALLLEEPYAANSPGYGYEDWQLNCRLIDRGVHNKLIPNTAIFVRRKRLNSEWLRQIQSMAVLRANPLLSFPAIRRISNPFPTYSNDGDNIRITQPDDLKLYAKKLIKQYPFTHKIAKRLKLALKVERISPQSRTNVPQWLQEEWRDLHKIDRQIFPSNQLLDNIAVYDTITEDHKKAGSLYKSLIDKLTYDKYDYLLFVPWLIKGGADQYAINYANAIATTNLKKRVLVVSTLPIKSIWSDRLHPAVDFLDFGVITESAQTEIKYRLMGHLIENGGISHIHIINSEFGYDFVRLHEQYIKATNKHVIVSSFSQSIDEEGRLYGYSHTHVPFIYDITSYITSDNKAVTDMWQNEYGFDKRKMLVHRQPIKLDIDIARKRTSNTPLRILWAARVSYEKQPDLIAQIARQLDGLAVIDVYGTIEEGNDQYLTSLPDNASYKGSFDGLRSLQLDTYDALLYTSLFDGMPNTILEAAQAKLPIIASSVGGIPEFITEETGFLITDIKNPSAYADAISLLSRDRSLGPKLAEQAYKKLETEFSVDNYDSNIKSFLISINY